MTNGIGAGKMPIMPQGYQSLTDMAIETTKAGWESDRIKQEVQIKQQEQQKKQEYLQRLSQSYAQQQAPSQSDIQASQDSFKDEVFTTITQQNLARMQKQLQDAAETGQLEEAAKLRDDINKEAKSLFDYTNKKKEERAAINAQGAAIMAGVTDTNSYRAGLKAVAEIEPRLANMMLQKYGPVFTKGVQQQLTRDSARHIAIKDQITNDRQERELKLRQTTEENTVKQRAIENYYKKRQDARSEITTREGVKTSRLQRVKTISEMNVPSKGEKVPESAYSALTINEEEAIKAVSDSFNLDFTDSEDKVILREAAGKAKIMSSKENIPFEEAMRKILSKREEPSITSVPTQITTSLPTGWTVKVK